MSMINAYGAGDATDLEIGIRQLITRRERLLGPAYRVFYRDPLHIVRGDGVWLYDNEGRRYLDVYNNVASVGHCHPEVVEALARQAALLNTHTRYLHAAILDYAQSLLDTFPDALGHVMFTCTGSEANDLALRIARRYTGGTGFIVTSLAYHGGTLAVAEISPSLGLQGALAPHVRTVPPPNPYRSTQDVEAALTSAVAYAIEDMKAHGIKPAALIVDSVFSSDGIFTHPLGSLRGAVDEIHKAGGVFIADEVQAGFGRTGATFWGFQRHGINPDMVSLGKPMGDGHPVAALVMRPECVAAFGAESRYFNTFGGNPVSAAVASAVLRIIQRDRLAESANRVGGYLRRRLDSLKKRYGTIGDIRGAGLFTGVELVEDPVTKTPGTGLTLDVVNALRERGVLISACGPAANVLKIRPPLIFDTSHVDLLIDTLESIFRLQPS